MNPEKRKLIKKYLSVSNKIIEEVSGSDILYLYYLEKSDWQSHEVKTQKELFELLDTEKNIKCISVGKFFGITKYDLSHETEQLDVKKIKIDYYDSLIIEDIKMYPKEIWPDQLLKQERIDDPAPPTW